MSNNAVREHADALPQSGAPTLPKALPQEIDYEALIAAAEALGLKQGTRGCVAFAEGAKWYRAAIANREPA